MEECYVYNLATLSHYLRHILVNNKSDYHEPSKGLLIHSHFREIKDDILQVCNQSGYCI